MTYFVASAGQGVVAAQGGKEAIKQMVNMRRRLGGTMDIIAGAGVADSLDFIKNPGDVTDVLEKMKNEAEEQLGKLVETQKKYKDIYEKYCENKE